MITPQKREYMRKWRENNKERIKASRKKYYTVNKDREIEYAKEWTRAHRETDRAKSKAYRAKHGSKERHREYCRKRYHLIDKYDQNFVLKGRLRARLRRAIVTSAKTGSAVRDLGCSIDEFKKYLEGKFTAGMSWDNWGGWHIDHIKPLAAFDLTDSEQFLEAVDYTNLQPLWANDNISKGRKWIS